MFSLINNNRRNPKKKLKMTTKSYLNISEQPINKPPVNILTVNKPPVNKPQDYSIKIMYIYSTKFTLFFADNLKSYFESINIKSKIINSSISNIDIEECRNNPNLYFFIIGPQYFINISRDYTLKTTGKPLNDLPKNKYIFYQIEQLNQTQNIMNSISKLEDLFEKSYAIFDNSIINLKYYSDNLRENVKLLSPLIYQEDINLEYLQEDTFAKEFTNKIINHALKMIKSKSEMNILFIGTINNRRVKILNRLKEDGYNVKIISKTIGQELIEEIKKSEIVLNLHYYPNSLLEIFRIHDLLPYDCKILSENPGKEEEMDLIEKYGKVVSFFPVIDDDLSNIDEMYKLIDHDFLANASAIAERKKFIEEVNEGNRESLKLKLNIKTYKIIVARYNENIEWTKNFNNVIIYNKGNKLDNFTNIIELDNVGREGHTYYKYIYDNYDSLPHYVIFLQGHPFNHSPNLYKNLNDIIDENNFKYFEWLSEYIHKDNLNGNPNHPGLKIGEYYKKIFKINIQTDYVEFKSGAQFLVSKESILSRTKDFYLNIIKTLDYNINPIEGYCLERLHKYIFTKKKEHCITIIVSRYNESVDWINSIINNNYIEKCIIFNKGLNNITINNYKIEIYNVKNIGREGGTYLDYIINNYDNFPENLIFTQADPFEHNDKFLDFLKDENIELYSHNQILTLTKQWKILDDIPPQKFVKYNNSYNIGNLELIKYFATDYDHQVIGHSAFFDWGVNYNYKEFIEIYKNYNKMKTVCDLIGLDSPKKIIPFIFSGCFFVKSKQIMRHSKEVYIKLRKFLYNSNNQGGAEGYILERFWHYLFTGESYDTINECLKELFVDIVPIVKIYCDTEKKIVFKNIHNSNNIIENENKYLIYNKLNNDIKILPGIDLDGPEIKSMECYNINEAKYL